MSNDSLVERIERIDDAVASWQRSGTIAGARMAAETVRNLVVGSGGPIYGDGNGDGKVSGASGRGVLPDIRGEAALSESGRMTCDAEALIGQGWDDPGARWARAISAIDGWAPGDSAVDRLPGPALRLAVWASISLEARSIDASRDFAERARREVIELHQAANGC